jgi:tRNA pseudouridine55 synthase
VHGVLLLDKPLGWSSNDALQKVKWLLRAEKGGHTGTLDPLASGVLPLCFGAATKFSQVQLDADKAYSARLQLGQTTSTADAEGQPLLTRPVAVTAQDLARVQQQFSGDIWQLPPMHSALKKDGKPLYDYARAGQTVERQTRALHIYKLNLALAPVEQALNALDLEVVCSKGTYIRTLGEDIGEALGCGAHVRVLRRTATGPYTLAQCVTLAQLEAMNDNQRLACLLPVDSLLAGWQAVTLDADNAGRFLSGLRRRGTWADAPQVAVYGPQGALLGSAAVRAGELIPTRLLNPLEVQHLAAVRAGATQPLAAPVFEESPTS